MKIAIVHDFLTELGGAEKVLLDLLKIYPQADLYTLFFDQKKLGQLFDKYQPQTSFLQRYPKFLKGAYLRPLSPMAIESLDLSGYDLVISNCNSFAKGVLVDPNTPHICYNHSPTRYLWDYYHRYLKDHNLSGLGGVVAKPLLSYLRLWDREAADRVDYYLANSFNVWKRIKKFYRAEAEIVYPGTEIDDFSINKKGDYFLIVSRLSKYKKVELAVKAFNQLPDRLVVIGAGPERNHLKSIAGKNVEILGFKTDEVVQSYYSRARGFIFPQEEDFGLTPVEAMASGVPVIAYQKGGVLETVKEGKTGMFFQEQSVKAIYRAIEEFKGIEEGFDRQEIREHSKQFSTKKFEEKFQRIVNQSIDDYQRKRK